MPPTSVQQVLLSPAELSYLYTSLSLSPPIRPDGRTSTQFRPLVAECNILPATNGSARVCFADGTEAIVGVKAEVEKTVRQSNQHVNVRLESEDAGDEVEDEDDRGMDEYAQDGEESWVELSVEIPGFRDDDSMPVFLAAMLHEALLADGQLRKPLYINRRFHWKLYIDILLLSTPLSYPLPLLSLTTHLALLSTRLPRLKSELDEDPMFDDDWDASIYLYKRRADSSSVSMACPSITLLVISVAENIIFDPSKEELAVAEAVLAVSVGQKPTESLNKTTGNDMEVDSGTKSSRDLHLLSVRTIDPPSRLTPPGVPNFLNTATGGTAEAASQGVDVKRDEKELEGVWQVRRGGTKRKLIARMIAKILEKNGVAEEVLDGLDTVDLG